MDFGFPVGGGSDRYLMDSWIYLLCFPLKPAITICQDRAENKIGSDRGTNIRRVLWNLKHLNQQWTNSVLCDLCSKLVHILGYLNGRLKSPIFL